VYVGQEEEYFTFCAPECKKAIDLYLDFRKRNGELVTKDSPLFVKQYNRMRRIKAQPYAENSLENLLQLWLENSGVRKPDPVNRYKRKQVQRLHGFRKFFTTQLVHSKVNPEIRELLLGHKIGLASAYYRPTEDEMLAEYEKAIDALTINPENRLKCRVNELTEKQDEITLMRLKHETEMKDMRQQMDKIISVIQENPKLARVKKEVLGSI
jgi:integrase/recombinase XerD